MAETAKTCAIVVTFNPEVPVLIDLLTALNREADFIVIDNGSANLTDFAAQAEALPRCRDLVRQKDNVGLARAINIGLQQALGADDDYALLFDQDSRPEAGFVTRLAAAADDLQSRGRGRLAAVGARIIDPRSGRQTPFKLFDRLSGRSDRPYPGAAEHFRADFLITSGSLLVLEHLPSIGLMKEDYFIDNVDLEWCFRSRSLGFELAGTDATRLYHSIGETSDDPLVRRGLMVQHSPARTYYSARNRIHLWGADYAPTGWKIRDRVRFALKSAWLILTSQQRLQYWKHIRQGCRDARHLS